MSEPQDLPELIEDSHRVHSKAPVSALIPLTTKEQQLYLIIASIVSEAGAAVS